MERFLKFNGVGEVELLVTEFDREELLWLLKKNYDAQEQYNLIHNPVHSGARVYFIRNPDAIDEYKKHLEQKKTRTSRQQNLKKKIQEFRRKENSGIMFRIPEETDEEPLTEGKLPVESMEIHNEKAHQNVRANNDFRHEKSDFDTNNDSGRERKRDSNILSKA
ncbi:uncharacterized protein LOC120635579 [Pararge aegeria]|uniref:uncharacterized protein LOC120635579 n=1 Tax=Pararge aegeria TaxID=116150 RepID=UPI0019D0B249|nr:uncharacterized protein LOC120635579 [Pararge aegeria]